MLPMLHNNSEATIPVKNTIPQKLGNEYATLLRHTWSSFPNVLTSLLFKQLITHPSVIQILQEHCLVHYFTKALDASHCTTLNISEWSLPLSLRAPTIMQFLYGYAPITRWNIMVYKA
jgi:hypothetical protein